MLLVLKFKSRGGKKDDYFEVLKLYFIKVFSFWDFFKVNCF